jgi:hypothetical protein
MAHTFSGEFFERNRLVPVMYLRARVGLENTVTIFKVNPRGLTYSHFMPEWNDKYAKSVWKEINKDAAEFDKAIK